MFEQDAVVDGVAQYMESMLQPVLVQGLTVLAKEKPCAHPMEALSFLGQWLLDNNPNKVSMSNNVRPGALIITLTRLYHADSSALHQPCKAFLQCS